MKVIPIENAESHRMQARLAPEWEDLCALVEAVEMLCNEYPGAYYTVDGIPVGFVGDAGGDYGCFYTKGALAGVDECGCVVGIAMRRAWRLTTAELELLEGFSILQLSREHLGKDGADLIAAQFLDHLQAVQDTGSSLAGAWHDARKAIGEANCEALDASMDLWRAFHRSLPVINAQPVVVKALPVQLQELAEHIAYDILCYLSYEADPRTREIENALPSEVYDAHEERIEALVLRRLQNPNAPKDPAGAGPSSK